MKKTKILSLIMVLALCLSAMAALSIGSSAANVNVAEGATATAGNGSSYVSKVLDGSTGDYFDLGFWSATDGGEPFGLEGTCYVEIDLGENTEISAIQVVNLIDPNRIYKWEAYATTDNTADISTWTKIGEKTDDKASDVMGTVVTFEKMNARYVRVYGTYHNQNIGYHINEVFIYDEYVTDNELSETDLLIAPKYDNIGNWREGTFFIVGFTPVTSSCGEIANKLKDGTYSLKVVITDETADKTYTISKYAFDHVDPDPASWPFVEVGHDNSYLRICASDYGIAPTADHVYTVALEITEGETVKHAGVSETGAFGLNADNGNSVKWSEEGPVVLENPPHLYDEAKVDDGGDGDVDAGDATALIAVLAVVALFGAAVVSKKVFVK